MATLLLEGCAHGGFVSEVLILGSAVAGSLGPRWSKGDAGRGSAGFGKIKAGFLAGSFTILFRHLLAIQNFLDSGFSQKRQAPQKSAKQPSQLPHFSVLTLGFVPSLGTTSLTILFLHLL